MSTPEWFWIGLAVLGVSIIGLLLGLLLEAAAWLWHRLRGRE